MGLNEDAAASCALRVTHVRTLDQAAAWLDGVGFALLFPSRGIALPSLWEAQGRKVIKKPAWDADMARLWEWKDQLPRRRRAWYGKLIRGKGTLVAARLLPHFSAAVSTPWELDAAETLYARGRLSPEARKIAAVLRDQGPQPTLALRYAAGFGDVRKNARFKKAIAELGARLLITHFGTKEEKGAAWPSTVYELVPRAFSRLSKRARKLSAEHGWREIERTYLSLSPGAAPRQAADFLRRIMK